MEVLDNLKFNEPTALEFGTFCSNANGMILTNSIVSSDGSVCGTGVPAFGLSLYDTLGNNLFTASSCTDNNNTATNIAFKSDTFCSVSNTINFLGKSVSISTASGTLHFCSASGGCILFSDSAAGGDFYFPAATSDTNTIAIRSDLDDYLTKTSAAETYLTDTDLTGYIKNNTTAEHALAIGGGNATKGYSIAIGNNSSTDTSDNRGYSVAIGPGAAAHSGDTIAIGRSSSVQGYCSIAIGSDAKTLSEASIAIGTVSSASDVGSIAIGRYATISENPYYGSANAIAIGTHACVNSYDAIAIGNTATSFCAAIAIGANSRAGDFAAIAFGKGSNAGKNSIAIGNCASVVGDESIAFGLQAEVCGYWAVALGGKSLACGENSTALGYSSSATSANAIAIGNATASGNYSTAIGPNASSKGFCSIAIGPIASANEDSAMAFGKESNANGAYSIAIGTSASTGSYCTHESIAIGNYASIDTGGAMSTAIGYRSKSTGFCAASLGSYSNANANYSSAFGLHSYTKDPGTTVISAYSADGAYPQVTQFKIVPRGSILSQTKFGNNSGGLTLEYTNGSPLGWIDVNPFTEIYSIPFDKLFNPPKQESISTPAVATDCLAFNVELENTYTNYPVFNMITSAGKNVIADMQFNKSTSPQTITVNLEENHEALTAGDYMVNVFGY